MSEHVTKAQEVCETPAPVDPAKQKRSRRWAYVISIAGVLLTILMFVAIIAFNDQVKEMQRWGYLGAFIISILGGATIIIPVPMLAVVVALASAMGTPWEVALLGFSSAGGELVGALIIYYTGTGAGRAISTNAHGRVQKAYQKMLNFIERRGNWALFAISSIINPFFYPAAFACGALKFGLRRFLFVVIIGKLIKCMSTVYLSYYGLKGIFRAIGIDI
jgi:membrane protein DedA with SNARE-associated domain